MTRGSRAVTAARRPPVSDDKLLSGGLRPNRRPVPNRTPNRPNAGQRMRITLGFGNFPGRRRGAIPEARSLPSDQQRRPDSSSRAPSLLQSSTSASPAASQLLTSSSSSSSASSSVFQSVRSLWDSFWTKAGSLLRLLDV